MYTSLLFIKKAPEALPPIALAADSDLYSYETRSIEQLKQQSQSHQAYNSEISPAPSHKYDSSGRTSQQSRRGSLLQDFSQRRPSQQNITGGVTTQPIESSTENYAIATNTNAYDIENKYTNDTYETEKLSIGATDSGIVVDHQPLSALRRKSSLRFYGDEIASNEIQNPRIESTQQDERYYKSKTHENDQIQEYSQQQSIQQDQYYAQPIYTDQPEYSQSDNIYTTDVNDSQPYTDQYEQHQTFDYQPTYQSEYQGSQPNVYDTQAYDQTNEQRRASNIESESHYQSGQYASPSDTTQQQGNPQPISSNSNVGKKNRRNGNGSNGNGNSNANIQQQQPKQLQQPYLSKQPSKSN